jgi:hypothetical protein
MHSPQTSKTQGGNAKSKLCPSTAALSLIVGNMLLKALSLGADQTGSNGGEGSTKTVLCITHTTERESIARYSRRLLWETTTLLFPLEIVRT